MILIRVFTLLSLFSTVALAGNPGREALRPIYVPLTTTSQALLDDPIFWPSVGRICLDAGMLVQNVEQYKKALESMGPSDKAGTDKLWNDVSDLGATASYLSTACRDKPTTKDLVDLISIKSEVLRRGSKNLLSWVQL